MTQEIFENIQGLETTDQQMPPGFDQQQEPRHRPWSRITTACAIGAVSLVAALSPGNFGATDQADAAVGQWISEFRDGVASPVIPGKNSSIKLENVDSATELRSKVRLTYLDRCVDSESQGQFRDSIERFAKTSNDNARYLKIEAMMESGLLTLQLKANSMAAKKRNFTINHDRCTRAPWIPYVPIGMPEGDRGKKKLEDSIAKAGCNLAPRNWIMDKTWKLNPQLQVDNGEYIIKYSWFGVDGTLNIPICKRLDRRDFDHTSPWPRWTREAYPKPLIFQYRTSEKQETDSR